MKITAYKCEMCGALSKEDLVASVSIRYRKEVDLMYDVVLEVCETCETEIKEIINRRLKHA